MSNHFKAVPGVCTYFCLPLREQKSLLAAPEEPPPPHLLPTEESSAPGCYRQTLCRLLICQFVANDNSDVFFKGGLSVRLYNFFYPPFVSQIRSCFWSSFFY